MSTPVQPESRTRFAVRIHQAGYSFPQVLRIWRAADRLGAAPHEGTGHLLALEELVTYLAKGLVDNPDEVTVTRAERDGATVFELRVAEADVGKVIGRQGRIARALRTIVRASGAHQNERVQLEIVNE